MSRGVIWFLVGSSGAGKSTLIRNALAGTWHGGRIDVPRKTTTRPLREATECVELISVSRAKFDGLIDAREFVTHYEIYGEKYGLTFAECNRLIPDTLRLQALPTEPALAVREALADWDVRICLISVRPDVAAARLCARADRHSIRTHEARANDLGRDRTAGADYVLDGNLPPNSVLEKFRSLVLSVG